MINQEEKNLPLAWSVQNLPLIQVYDATFAQESFHSFDILFLENWVLLMEYYVRDVNRTLALLSELLF